MFYAFNARIVQTASGPACPVHGPQPGVEYKQQTPAPCGCDWVWEPGEGPLDWRLVVAPHR